MLTPDNTWPETAQSSRVLFFAQLVRELLSPNTFESNRVYSLDTLSRLKECSALYDDFRGARITKNTLVAPFEEAGWSVCSDPVVLDVMTTTEIDTLRSELSKKDSLSDQYTAAIYLRNRIQPIYKRHIETQITKILSSDNNKNALRTLTSNYCSHLINIGYSRDYISQACFKVFFSSNHSRISHSKVKKFFKYFTGKYYHYYVYSEVSKDFGKLLSGIGIEIKTVTQKLSRNNALVKSKFQIESRNRYALIKTSAMDELAALSEANTTLENIRALAFLNPGAADVVWNQKFYVLRKNKQTGSVCSLPENPIHWLSPQTSSEPRILKDVRRYTNRILSNFESESTERILRSVSTAAFSRNASSVETQLIALWSAVEGLLAEPFENKSRIEHFSDLMVPCICSRHLHRRSIYVYDQMRTMYGNKFNRIVRRELEEETEHYKFTKIMMFDEYKSLRVELLQIAKKNPLAMHRMYQFYTDVKNPKNLYDTITSHEQRVRWQISRIYRVRNSLVHKADKPGYLDSVVLNMFEYYIRMLACLVRSASKSETPSNLDQVVSGIYLDSISTKKLIRDKRNINLNDKEIFVSLHK